MTLWTNDRIDDFRAAVGPDAVGDLWMMFFDDPDGPPMLGVPITDAMNHLADQLLVNLAHVISLSLRETPAQSALLLVPSDEAEPTAEVRRTWARIRELVDPALDLTDLLVISPENHWSAMESAA